MAAEAPRRRGGSGAPFTVALLWAWLGDGSPNGNDAASARDEGERRRIALGVMNTNLA